MSHRSGDRQERKYQSLKNGDKHQEDLEQVPVFQPVDFPLPVALLHLGGSCDQKENFSKNLTFGDAVSV